MTVAKDKKTNESKDEISPLEIVYSPIRDFAAGRPTAFRGILRIHSTEAGTLMPDDYRYASEKTARGTKLSQMAAADVIETVSALVERKVPFDWVSFYAPTKMLLNSNIAWQLEKKFTTLNFGYASKICVEIDSSVLFENSEAAAEKIEALHKLGCHVMISGFGNEFCPITRLRNFPFNTVLLDACLFRNGDEGGEVASRAVINLSHGLGHFTAADYLETEELRNDAERQGCDAYCDDKYLTREELTAFAEGGS